jgi:hypothetical protein
MRGFDWANSNAWLLLTGQFGEKIKQEELVSIAQVVAARGNIPFDRDARRRKGVIIKWFQDNWNVAHFILPFVVLEPSESTLA